MTDKRPVTAHDLLAMQWAGDAQISPDGRRVAFVRTVPVIEKNSYQSAIWMAEEGREVRAFTSGQGKDGPARDKAPRWSPDGSCIAFLSNRAGKDNVWIIPSGGGEARHLFPFDEGVSQIAWSPDGRYLAFVARTPKTKEEKEADEKRNKDVTVITRLRYKANGVGLLDPRPRHLWVVGVADGQVRQLTRGEYDDSSPAWSPSGLEIAFTSARRPDRELETINDLWVVSVVAGEPRRLVAGVGSSGEPAWSPDGRNIAYFGQDGRDGAAAVHLWVVATAEPDGWPNQPADLFAGAGFDRNAGCSVGADARAESGGSGPYWSADGADIYFAATDGPDAPIYRVSAAGGGAVERVTPAVDLAVTSFSVAAPPAASPGSFGSRPRFGYVGAHFLSTGDVYLMDEGQEPVRLSGLNDELFSELALAVPDRFTVKSTDGWEIEGWIMKPFGYTPGKKYPAVLEIHGGPAGTSGHAFFHEYQLLAAHGWGVFFSNPRGSTGYGQKFAHGVIGDWGGMDYADVMAITDYAASRDWVDTKRLGVTGGSYGGFMTNWIVGHTDRFAAAVTCRSVVNMYSKYGVADNGYNGNRKGFDGRDLWDSEDFIMERSPIRYAPRVKTPILIIHSDQDYRCPLEQGEQWFVALKRPGKTVEFARFTGESHELSRSGKPRNRLSRLELMMGWFERYLK